RPFNDKYILVLSPVSKESILNRPFIITSPISAIATNPIPNTIILLLNILLLILSKAKRHIDSIEINKIPLDPTMIIKPKVDKASIHLDINFNLNGIFENGFFTGL